MNHQSKNSKSLMPTLSHSSAKPAKYKSEKNDAPPILSIIKGASIGLIVYLLAFALSTFAFSVIAYAGPDPNSLVFILSMAAAALSSLIGGFVSSKLSGEGFLSCGLVFALFMITVSLLMSLFFKTDSSGISFFKHLLLKLPYVGASVAGAFIGSIKKKATYQHKYR